MNSRLTATLLFAANFLSFFAAAAPVPAPKTATVPVVETVTVPVAKAATILAAKPAVTRMIVVSLQDRRLALVENGVVKAVYPVAVGKASTPSPTGTFTIVNHVINPTYYHHGVVIPPGPDNPVGNRWMGLSIPGYGIHGTNVQRSVGRAVSHGCIRLRRHDLEKLFAQVRVGDTVEIIGQPDAQTEAIFDAPAIPHSASSLAAALTAKIVAPAAPATPAEEPSTAATLAEVAIPAAR